MSDTQANGARATDGTPQSLDPELLADFGHLLRNQLNAIVGAAGLLSATATSSDQRELASVVLTGSEQLAGLVDEVPTRRGSRAETSSWRCTPSTCARASSRASHASPA